MCRVICFPHSRLKLSERCSPRTNEPNTPILLTPCALIRVWFSWSTFRISCLVLTGVCINLPLVEYKQCFFLNPILLLLDSVKIISQLKGALQEDSEVKMPLILLYDNRARYKHPILIKRSLKKSKTGFRVRIDPPQADFGK